MDNVPHDILGIGDNGQINIMKSNSGLHKFTGANNVVEIPIKKQGGSKQGDQLSQIIQMYAQISKQDPTSIMKQLQGMKKKDQQSAIQQMAQQVQQAVQQQNQPVQPNPNDQSSPEYQPQQSQMSYGGVLPYQLPHDLELYHMQSGGIKPHYNFPSAYNYDLGHPDFNPELEDSTLYSNTFNKALHNKMNPDTFINVADNISNRRQQVQAENSGLPYIDPARHLWLQQMIQANAVKDANSNKKQDGGSQNNSIVDYLASHNQSFDKQSRQQLAQKFGINNYDFSANKNNELLNKLRQSESSKQNTNDNIRPVQIQQQQNLPLHPEYRQNYQNQPDSTNINRSVPVQSKQQSDSNVSYGNWKDSLKNTLQSPINYMGADNRTLESGFIVDKGTNTGYIMKNNKPVKSFPVLTGKNSKGNDNTKSVDWMEQHPNEADQYRATPTGSYMMNPTFVYGNKGFGLNPIQAFNQLAPSSSNIYAHTTYDPQTRDKFYNMSPRDRDVSYGGVNCQKPNINELVNSFPHGDTAMIIDSRNQKDMDFLKNKENIHYQQGGVTSGEYQLPVAQSGVEITGGSNIWNTPYITNNQNNNATNWMTNSSDQNNLSRDQQQIPNQTQNTGFGTPGFFNQKAIGTNKFDFNKINTPNPQNMGVEGINRQELEKGVTAKGSIDATKNTWNYTQNGIKGDPNTQQSKQDNFKRPTGVEAAGAIIGGLDLINKGIENNYNSGRVRDMNVQRGLSNDQFNVTNPIDARGNWDSNSNFRPNQQVATQFANVPVKNQYGQSSMPFMQMGGLPEILSDYLPSNVQIPVTNNIPSINDQGYNPTQQQAPQDNYVDVPTDKKVDLLARVQGYLESGYDPTKSITSKQNLRALDLHASRSIYGLYQVSDEERRDAYKNLPDLKQMFKSFNDYNEAFHNTSDPKMQQYVQELTYKKYLAPRNLQSVNGNIEAAALTHYIPLAGKLYAQGKLDLNMKPGNLFPNKAYIVKEDPHNDTFGNYLNKFREQRSKIDKFKQGGSYDLSHDEIKRLQDQGYELEIQD